MKYLLLLFSLLFTTAAFTQDKPAYILYDAKGKKISYQKMIRVLREKDIALFGEYHNNPISHWLQLEVTRDCQQHRSLILGAEMFERDNQEAVNRYLKGEIDDKQLAEQARLWKNYDTDYAPLVNFAKANNLPFIGTNIPRRYASLVAKGGFEALDTLPAEAKTWIAPLPIVFDPELPGYKKMVEMMGDHGTPNIVKAQAIKDATMAHFLMQAFRPGSLFIHYNGSYHSDNYEGILWYLRRQNPSLRYATISTVSQSNPHVLLPENKGIADFIICVDEDMTGTY
ncbi:MAG: ChaN family lipoprotein [Saprospiraceae bacterium]|nr:ChaN family lipoprotein [Saprospiraceae bacterium]